MAGLADLSQAIADYQLNKMSLDEFEDRFRTDSRQMFAEGNEMLAACVAIESAFSELRYGAIDEERFGEELVDAIVPFVLDSARNSYGDPSSAAVESTLAFEAIAAMSVVAGQQAHHPVALG